MRDYRFEFVEFGEEPDYWVQHQDLPEGHLERLSLISGKDQEKLFDIKVVTPSKFEEGEG